MGFAEAVHHGHGVPAGRRFTIVSAFRTAARSLRPRAGDCLYVNARVGYRSLDGCEARIIGKGDEAIITVNANSTYRRKRFSIAHELGHWHHYRGKCLACRAEECRPRERSADGYTADLLMERFASSNATREGARSMCRNKLADAFSA